MPMTCVLYGTIMLAASLSATLLITWGWYLARQERRLLAEMRRTWERARDEVA